MQIGRCKAVTLTAFTFRLVTQSIEFAQTVIVWSAAHSDFLAAGGLGLLIGDGMLNYGHERILETYYAYSIDKNFTITANYQLITNPAYNVDRGPVSIFSARLHGEF